MAGTAALCLLLLFPVSSSLSTLHSQQEISAHQAPAAPPPPAPAPPHPRGLLQKEETTHFNAKETCKYGARADLFSIWLHGHDFLVWKRLTAIPTDALSDKDNDKVGLFIAASVGTFALMAAVYCIYNKFYTKQQYLHTQLNDDSGEPADPP